MYGTHCCTFPIIWDLTLVVRLLVYKSQHRCQFMGIIMIDPCRNLIRATSFVGIYRLQAPLHAIKSYGQLWYAWMGGLGDIM